MLTVSEKSVKVSKENIGRMAKIVVIRNLETGSPERRKFLGAVGSVVKVVKCRNAYVIDTEHGTWEAFAENVEFVEGVVS